MDKNFQVSIGMPVFNGEKHVRQAIDSLLAQDFKNIELVISDNGSTDRTPEICREYARQDQRVRYQRNEINQGPVWNFNNVFHLTSSGYFMWASHDDSWEPSYITACMETLAQQGSVILAGTACDCINAQNAQVILIDPGVTTVGCKPADRFRMYKQALHTGKNINALFYGIYRRDSLSKVMPLENMMGMDHIVLAKASLLGDFFTSEKRLMKKKWGGASASLEGVARVMRITNPLVIRSVYFVREVVLQKIIFSSDRLNFLEKIKLSCWSWGNYLFLFLRFRYRDLRDFMKSILKGSPHGS